MMKFMQIASVFILTEILVLKHVFLNETSELLYDALNFSPPLVMQMSLLL